MEEELGGGGLGRFGVPREYCYTIFFLILRGGGGGEFHGIREDAPELGGGADYVQLPGPYIREINLVVCEILNWNWIPR